MDGKRAHGFNFAASSGRGQAATEGLARLNDKITDLLCFVFITDKEVLRLCTKKKRKKKATRRPPGATV